MKEYKSNSIRNVALLGHLGTGKTSFGEALLFAAKAIDKKGEVERKNTIGDYSSEEQARLTTLTASLLPVEWKNTKINFLDTPGSEEFIGEIDNVLAVADGAILLVDATKGVEVGTERSWAELRKRKIPTLIVVNKLDKENVKFDAVVSNIKNVLSKSATLVAYPDGLSENFKGVGLALSGEVENGSGISAASGDLLSHINGLREELMEPVAETSEDLMMVYFDAGELSTEELEGGIKTGVNNCDFFPIIPASGLKNIGVTTILDMLVKYVNAASEQAPKEGIDPKTKAPISRKPDEQSSVSGIVFKNIVDPFIGSISFFKLMSGTLKAGQDLYVPATDTVIKVPPLFTMMGKNQINLDTVYAGDIACLAKISDLANGTTICDKRDVIQYPFPEVPTPIIYVAIAPKNKQDEDKLSGALARLKVEDSTFITQRNPETAQLLIGGQGMTHINYILEKMRNMFKVEVTIDDPKIVYRETIRAKGEAQGRHKKQSGGAGQFGDVWIRFEPTDKDFEFAEEVFGGSVPKNYFPAVEKGLIETLEHGPLAGFPVVGVKATLFDGSYHPVDSNELSFKLAARLAFQNACDKIKPTILEPIIEVTVEVKDEFVGDIMGDITKRRGRILKMDQANGWQQIIAEVPEVEIIKYATDLKAMTQASGRFSRRFLRYDEVPEMLVKKIIEEYKK